MSTARTHFAVIQIGNIVNDGWIEATVLSIHDDEDYARVYERIVYNDDQFIASMLPGLSMKIGHKFPLLNLSIMRSLTRSADNGK